MALFALSIERHLRQLLLAGEVRGRVHSVFTRVVNIRFESGALSSFGCRTIDNAPDTLILDIAGFGATGIGVGDAVRVADGSLLIGSAVRVALAGARTWAATLSGYPDATRRLRANLGTAQLRLSERGGPGGRLGEHPDKSLFDVQIARQLRERSARLLSALSDANQYRANQEARSLLGLGPGLTPSGDDVLVGLFAVLNVARSPCHGWLGGGADVLAGAAHATNEISLAALSNAAAGRVRESIGLLIECLMYSDGQRLEDPLQRVFAIGSTSGADIVAGIVCGFEANLRVADRRSDSNSMKQEGVASCP